MGSNFDEYNSQLYEIPIAPTMHPQNEDCRINSIKRDMIEKNIIGKKIKAIKMNEENYTSLWLSEKLYLGGCNIETQFEWQSLEDSAFCLVQRMNCDLILEVGFNEAMISFGCDKSYPAFDILNDICVRHSEEFFEGSPSNIRRLVEDIFELMRDREKQIAEKYILDNCVFNKESSEK